MVQWLEYVSTDSQFVDAANAFNVHPLALEDCQHRDQRPKLDDYENHQLLVWFVYVEGRVYELQFLIFPDKLLVVPHEPPPGGQSWKSFLKISEAHKDVWHMLYQALDHATDVTWIEMRKLFSEIDSFEDTMFVSEINPQALLQLKKTLNKIELSIGHLSSVTHQLQNLCKPKGDLNWKLRDLYDHLDRIYRSIGLYRSQISSTIELYWGLQANRANRQIKKLSLLASVAVPLTFWASFWGMNFQSIPFHSAHLFILAITIMILSVAITMWLLIKKGYWSD